MEISLFYFCFFKLFLAFSLCALSIMFVGAFLQKEVAGKNAFFCFLGLACLITYYFIWLLGRISPLYLRSDLSLLFNFILVLGIFLVYRQVKSLFK